jgi:hypothetical protein
MGSLSHISSIVRKEIRKEIKQLHLSHVSSKGLESTKRWMWVLRYSVSRSGLVRFFGLFFWQDKNQTSLRFPRIVKEPDWTTKNQLKLRPVFTWSLTSNRSIKFDFYSFSPFI